MVAERYDKTINIMTAKGWLTEGERHLLFDLASRLPGSAVILNIGVEFGASVACLRAGNRAATIHAFDLDMSKVLEGGYGAELHEEDSHEAVKTWAQPIDLAFIDGDHGQAGVVLDAKYADWLPISGYILFQDCWSWGEGSPVVHPMVPGVNAGVDEWFAKPNIKQEFEELESVDTTRVFRRSKEFGYGKSRMANSGGPDTDIQPGGATDRELKVHEPEPKIRRGSKGNRR